MSALGFGRTLRKHKNVGSSATRELYVQGFQRAARALRQTMCTSEFTTPNTEMTNRLALHASRGPVCRPAEILEVAEGLAAPLPSPPLLRLALPAFLPGRWAPGILPTAVPLVHLAVGSAPASWPG